MVNETRDRIHGHGTGSAVLNIDVSPHLIRIAGGHSKNTVNDSRILSDPFIGKGGKLLIVISKVPDIQRLSILRTHLTSNPGGLITIIGPCFLISENFIVLGSTLSENLLVFHSLFADIGEYRPVIIKARLAAPETLKTLLIGMIITSNHNADNKAMLNKRLLEIMVSVRSHGKANRVPLGALVSSLRLLDNLIDIDRNTVATKILRTLEASIRGSNTEMGLQDLDIASTTTSILLIHLLNLEGHTKLIDGSGGGITIPKGPQIIRNSITKGIT